MDVPIEDTEEYDWETGEDDIIQLYVPLIEHCHGAEATPICIEVMWESKCDVLVEKIQDETRDARISRAPMKENQSPQLLELRYSEIRCLHGTKTFVSVQTNAYMRFIDH